MADVASNILYTLVARQLARQGIAAAAPAGPAPTEGTVPLRDKTDLLAAAYAAHGPLPILRVGEGIREAGPEPTLEALLLARGPMDLLARWQRLERYVHSRHRVLLRDGGPGWMLAEHVSTRDGEAPSAAEDCLILGLLLALMAATGAGGLSAAMADPAGDRPVFAAGTFRDPGPGTTALWRLRWAAEGAGHDPLAGRAGPLPFPVDGDARALVARVVDLVLSDCSRPWTLAAVARATCLSTRTLQRRLAEAGTSFAAVVRTAQVRQAAGLLLGGRLSVAEVGLLCGFSDQAHFTREFKRRTNIPPGRYRAEFAAPKA